MNTLGEMICDVRKSFGLTQPQLAKLANCSTQEIFRAENNIHGQNYKLITKLSQALNFDFLTYSINIDTLDSTDNLASFIRLKDAIACRDKDAIAQAIAETEERFPSIKHQAYKNQLPSCKKEAFQMYCCGQAFLVESIDEAVLCLYKAFGLKAEIFEANLNRILSARLSDTEYRILVTLSGFWREDRRLNSAESLLEKMISNLQQFVFHEKYAPYCADILKVRVMTSVYHNLANVFFDMERYEQALDACVSGIEFCLKYKYSEYLHLLYTLKFETLYKLQRYGEANVLYRQTVILCQLLEYNDFIQTIQRLVAEKYPRISL